MLQQTQVERVKVYFENILTAFPTVEDLAACSYEDFFPYYKWLGYYSRARNMLKTAQKIANDFGWIFPNSVAELKTLPWIWPYTAEAIMAFAYDEPTLSFDTNLEKIFSRYYYGNKFQKLSKEEKQQITEDFKQSWLSWRDINNALMDYGAIVSLNSVWNICWDRYPLHSSKFYKTRGSLEPISEKKKSNFPNKEAYVIAIVHENHKVYFSCPTSFWGSGTTEESSQQGANTLDPSLHSGWHNTFTPFLIGKNTWNPRKQIQEYFSKHYHLELSVRPPEVKSYNKKEAPYIVCYCQIQSGTSQFKEFRWLKIRWFEEWYVEELEFWENSLF